jgi:hypothetical protein
MVDDPVSGRIYLFGGVGEADALSTVEVYNPFENEWDYLKPIPEPKKTCHPVIVGSHVHLYENGKKTVTYDRTCDKWIDETPDEAFVPKCPLNGRVCSTCTFSGGEVIIFNYPVRGSDGVTKDRWLIAHMAQKRTKTWTVMPPVDAFTYYKMAVADGRLVIATAKSLLAFQLVDDMVDDASTVASSCSSSQSGSMRNSSVLSSDGSRVVEPIKDDVSCSRVMSFGVYKFHLIILLLRTTGHMGLTTRISIQTERLSRLCCYFRRRFSIHFGRL